MIFRKGATNDEEKGEEGITIFTDALFTRILRDPLLGDQGFQERFDHHFFVNGILLKYD